MDALPQGTILRGEHTYKIIKKLGQGTFGITYLATMSTTIAGKLGAIDTEVKVAIKEFFMRDINGRDGTIVTCGSKGGIYEDYKKKFIREARNLGKLQHPNIVKVVEDFEANNTVYFAMEYISGGNLDDYINNKGKLSEGETVRIAKQIGKALSFLHSKRMLHLDLKPGNIMMCEDGTPVLIDFGLSKQYDQDGNPESSTTVGGGTPGYAPSEQADYQDGEGFPMTMDVYAFGGTIYKMLTGKRPPKASVILNNGFPDYDLQECGVSDSLAACIAKAMAPMKKVRYQTVKEFITAIEKEGLPTEENTIIQEEDEEPVIVEVIEPGGRAYSGDDYGNNDDDDDDEEEEDNNKTLKYIPGGLIALALIFILIFLMNSKNELPQNLTPGEGEEIEAEVVEYSPADSLKAAFDINDSSKFYEFLTQAKAKIDELMDTDPATAKKYLEAVQNFLKEQGDFITMFVGTNSALATLVKEVSELKIYLPGDIKDAAEDAKGAVDVAAEEAKESAEKEMSKQNVPTKQTTKKTVKTKTTTQTKTKTKPTTQTKPEQKKVEMNSNKMLKPPPPEGQFNHPIPPPKALPSKE